MAEYGDSDTIKTKSGLSHGDLGFVDEAAYTTFVLILNQQVSQLVEEWCGRDFLKHIDDIATMDGSGRNELVLPGYPVISIAHIKIDGNTLDAATYRIKPNTAPVSTIHNSGVVERKYALWADAWDNTEIKYTWGFDPTPPVVAQVVEAIAAQELREMKVALDSKGADSVSMDGYSTSYTIEREKFSQSGIMSRSAVYYAELDRLQSFRVWVVV